MFCLDAVSLNDELCERAKRLEDTLITFEVEENRELNKRYTTEQEQAGIGAESESPLLIFFFWCSASQVKGLHGT